MSEHHGRWIPSFVRNHARALTDVQKTHLEDALPPLTPHLPESGVTDDIFAMLRMDEAPQNIWLEIGFGSGEHLVAQAKANPDALLVGCEPFVKGMAKALYAVEQEAVTNVRMWNNDARLLIDALPDVVLDRVFILFPDPWPKARHHKRRIVNAHTLGMLARVMKPGAELRLATDIPNYAAWMLEHTLAHPAFAWQAHDMGDIRNAPEDWVRTRYQQKAEREGRQTAYLRFSRV